MVVNGLSPLFKEENLEVVLGEGAGAQQLYDALDAADETRDTQEGDITDARLGLADDRAAIARAQRRLKAQLELKFEDVAKVYSFFDFAKARGNKKAPKDTPTPGLSNP